jgi:hypothetical protein
VKKQISDRSNVMLNFSQIVVVALQVPAKIYITVSFILNAET